MNFLPELPPAMKRLPIDHRGFVVPFFVAWIDGKPDHRVVDPAKLQACISKRICWLCGLPIGLQKMAFVVGPMCGINRTSSEPAQHIDCARYAVRACPFLTRPHMHRRDAGLPDVPLKEAAGVMLMHNPGVALIWITKKMRIIREPMGKNGILFLLGEPESIEFWTEGRIATRAEIDASIDIGVAKLCETIPMSADERLAFSVDYLRFKMMLPKE